MWLQTRGQIILIIPAHQVSRRPEAGDSLSFSAPLDQFHEPEALLAHPDEAITGRIAKVFPGTLYLATWAGHDYAWAALDAPSEFDVAGDFVRATGGSWTATRITPASDVGPACEHPPALLHLWFNKSLLESC